MRQYMTKRGFKRPKDDQELIRREAAGFWRAQALSTEIAESAERITIESILRIHQEFFREATPEIAGRFRHNGDDVKKLKCIEPPPGRVIEERMHAFWREMDTKFALIPKKPKDSKKARAQWNREVIECAAWVHHQITAIHPFCQGNGRMARIMNNMVLRRFNIQPSDFQDIGNDKSRYLDALCQIDKMQDYEPLKQIIAEAIRHTYHRVYKIAQKAQEKRKRRK